MSKIPCSVPSGDVSGSITCIFPMDLPGIPVWRGDIGHKQCSVGNQQLSMARHELLRPWPICKEHNVLLSRQLPWQRWGARRKLWTSFMLPSRDERWKTEGGNETEYPIQTTLKHNSPFWDKKLHRGETEEPYTNASELMYELSFLGKWFKEQGVSEICLKDSFIRKNPNGFTKNV